MKFKRFLKSISAVGILMMSAGSLSAQSLPAPGSGGSFQPGNGGGSMPAPGSGGYYQPNNWGPAVPPPASWGTPWSGNTLMNVSIGSPGWQNQGTMTVIACGYDTMGIWRTIPLRVAYSWNGVQYQVTVLNAWNPWSDMWNIGINQQAFVTSYYTHGQTYDFYVPLSTGTWYFNL